MRPHVDPTRCRGYGVCHEISARHFSTDDWGLARTTGEQVGPTDTAEVEAAITRCPFDAIRWIEGTAGSSEQRSAREIAQTPS